MTASNEADNKGGSDPDKQVPVSGQSDLDRIMLEIESLQTEAAALSSSGSQKFHVEPNRTGPLDSSGPSDPNDTSSLFKEIEGGEGSLLAETLAGVSSPWAETKKPPEVQQSVAHEEFQSESVLAEALAPALLLGKQPLFGPALKKPINSLLEPLERGEAGEDGKLNSPQGGDSSDNALSMTVTGKMSLKLNFEYEGEEVLVSFDTDKIHIQFSEGTEFKIPLKRNRSKKAA